MKEITANGKAVRRMVDERIKQIATVYGYDAQSRQCIEKMAELTKAINKMWRKSFLCGFVTLEEVQAEETEKTKFSDEKEWKDVVEEIADVEIMLEQMKVLLNCTDDVKAVKEQKLERQIKRIREREKTENGI